MDKLQAVKMAPLPVHETAVSLTHARPGDAAELLGVIRICCESSLS